MDMKQLLNHKKQMINIKAYNYRINVLFAQHLRVNLLNISAGQRFIVINCIQNKIFCVHNICVCAVYIYYVYINTHTCMYIFNTNILCLYIKHLYIYINDMNKNTCKYFLNIYCICVSLYLHNKYTQHTHIDYVHKIFYFGCNWSQLMDAI